MNNTDIPRGILVLDLPSQPLINGFGFAAPLLPVEEEAALRDKWYRGDTKCDPDNLAELSGYGLRCTSPFFTPVPARELS